MPLTWPCYYLDPRPSREAGARSTSGGPHRGSGILVPPGNEGMDKETKGKDLVPTLISAFLDPITA